MEPRRIARSREMSTAR
jgi:hypothetical protein